MSYRAAWLLASLALVGSARTAPEPHVRTLAPFPEDKQEIVAWMKAHRWTSKRNSPRRCEVGGRRLRLVSNDDSVLIGTRDGFPLDPEAWPRLRFRLRVDAIPTGTDLTRKRGDDAAFRVYVAFDRGGSWISPPDTIAYTWSEDLAPETLVPSPHFRGVSTETEHFPPAYSLRHSAPTSPTASTYAASCPIQTR